MKRALLAATAALAALVTIGAYADELHISTGTKIQAA